MNIEIIENFDHERKGRRRSKTNNEFMVDIPPMPNYKGTCKRYYKPNPNAEKWIKSYILQKDKEIELKKKYESN